MNNTSVTMLELFASGKTATLVEKMPIGAVKGLSKRQTKRVLKKNIITPKK